MKSKTNPFRSTAISGAAVVFACFSMLNSSVKASTYDWTGATDSNYSTGSNWVGGVAAPFDWAPVVQFTSAVVNGTVNVPVHYLAGSVVVASGATTDITFTGAQLELGKLAPGDPNSDATVHLAAGGSNLTFNSEIGNAGWDGLLGFDVGAGRTLTINGGYAGNIEGGGPATVIKTGTGEAVITSGSTNIGAMQIFAGTVTYANPTAAGGAGTVSVNAGNVNFSSGNTGATIHTPMNLAGDGGGSGALSVYAPGSTVKFDGAISVSGAMIRGYGDGTKIEIQSGMTGSGGLTFAGNTAGPTTKNTLVLSGASTFTGDLDIVSWNAQTQVTLSGGVDRLPTTALLAVKGSPTQRGVLDLNGNNQTSAGISDAIGWGAIDANGRNIVNTSSTAATLTLNTTADQSSGVTIGGTDINDTAGDNLSLVKTGTATQTLSGANTYSGATSVTGGILTFGNTAARSASTTVTAAAAGTVGLGVGGTGYYSDVNVAALFNNNSLTGFNLDPASGVAIDTTAGHFTQSTALTASRALTKLGSNTLTLTGANTYNGVTTINAGTLTFDSVAAVGSTSGITVNAGGSLIFDSGTANGTISTPISLNGDGAGNAALNTSIPGSQITFTAPITLLGGSLIRAIGNNSTINFNNSIHGIGGLTFAGFGGGTGTKDFMVLSGISDFTGDFSIVPWYGAAQVTLNGGDDRLPTTALVAVKGSAGMPGALDLNGNNQTVAGLSDEIGWGGMDAGARNVVNTSATPVTLTLHTTADQSSGVTIGGTDINGTPGNNLSLVKTGSAKQTLTGANTYTGNTTVTGGTLALGASNVLPDGTQVTIGNATLDAATFTDAAGPLAMSGGGTIHLGTGAALAFADSHSVSWSGTLTLTGTYVSGSSLRFGTDANGLTSGQLASISKPGGGAVTLNASGYLVDAASGYAEWKVANSTSGTINQDHDNDGVANGIEYFLHGNTNTTGFTALPSVINTAGTRSITWTKAADYTGIYNTDYVVETSTTLTGAWQVEPGTGGQVTLTGNDVKYTFPAPTAGSKKFARLKVTGP